LVVANAMFDGYLRLDLSKNYKHVQMKMSSTCYLRDRSSK